MKNALSNEMPEVVSRDIFFGRNLHQQKDIGNVNDLYSGPKITSAEPATAWTNESDGFDRSRDQNSLGDVPRFTSA